jgi:hypothetical protein
MHHHRDPGDDDLPQLDLTALDGAFAAAPARAARPIPDGRYHVSVEHVELTTAHRSRRPILKWKLRVRAPACAGAVLWKNHVVTPENLGWLKHDLRLCGLLLAKLSDLPEHLDQLLDIDLEVTKRTNLGWENVYFNHRVYAAASPDGGGDRD